MAGSATCCFSDATDYQAAWRDIFAALVPTGSGRFAAHTTWVTLRHMTLRQAEETVSRVAFVALPSDITFISFSSDPARPLIWRGQTLGPGEIMLHGRGEHLHQRTDGASCWGLVSLKATVLADVFKLLTGRALERSELGRVLIPPEKDLADLLRINAEAAHLAETRPQVLAHPEVIRAMEQELTGLLVSCLETSEIRVETALTLHNTDIVARLEAVVAANPERLISLAELRFATGASDRALRRSCQDVLGVAPQQYLRLRRLTLVRHAILHADPAAVRLGELVRQSGFADYRNFAMMYRCMFGETPSATLRRGSML